VRPNDGVPSQATGHKRVPGPRAQDIRRLLLRLRQCEQDTVSRSVRRGDSKLPAHALLRLNLGAVILPWIEFISGLFLIIGFKSRASVILIGLLLIVFDIMILINMYWGAPITCGCYDTVGEPIGWKKVSENALMLVCCVQIYLYDKPMLFGRWGLFPGAKKRTARSEL